MHIKTAEIIKLLEEGWELKAENGYRPIGYRPSCWIQKKLKIINIHYSTFKSMEKKRIIIRKEEVKPNTSYWVAKYKLNKKRKMGSC